MPQSRAHADVHRCVHTRMPCRGPGAHPPPLGLCQGLMRELELRERRIKELQSTGDRLLREEHPGRQTLEVRGAVGGAGALQLTGGVVGWWARWLTGVGSARVGWGSAGSCLG